MWRSAGEQAQKVFTPCPDLCNGSHYALQATQLNGELRPASNVRQSLAGQTGMSAAIDWGNVDTSSCAACPISPPPPPRPPRPPVSCGCMRVLYLLVVLSCPHLLLCACLPACEGL